MRQGKATPKLQSWVYQAWSHHPVWWKNTGQTPILDTRNGNGWDLRWITSNKHCRCWSVSQRWGVAGVRLWQAAGDSEPQVYNRLQRKDIRALDVFIVILDVEIIKEITISEQKKHINKYEDKGKQSNLRTLFIQSNGHGAEYKRCVGNQRSNRLC